MLEYEQYIGIADAHGIESFVKLSEVESSRPFIFLIRAQANRHRHALFYSILVDKATIAMVDTNIKKGKYDVALKLLKKYGKDVQFPKQINGLKSWKMIPNSDLDPYHP